MKVVINVKHGGFGISEAAYEKLAEWGIPVRKYVQEQQDPDTKLYKDEPLNEGEVIFDRELTPLGECSFNDIYHKFKGKSRMSIRYWDTGWLRSNRSHPLLLRLMDEMGAEAASGVCANLKVVEIPDGIEYDVSEYDGMEWIAEKHRTWS